MMGFKDMYYMKKVLLLLSLLMPVVAYSQDDSEKHQTKFEQLASRTGRMSKFVDVKMPGLSYLETSVRTIFGEHDNYYFYRIEKPETSSSVSKIAMIEYSDLVEINKALEKLLRDVEADVISNPDYLENRYMTEDGFRIGYYVDGGKANWFITLERYGHSTVFIKKDVLAECFQAAQKKIEELKTANGK